MTLNTMKEWQKLDIIKLQETIIELKKEIILMRIKKKTQQNIKPHLLKNKKHQLAQMLTLETFKLKQ